MTVAATGTGICVGVGELAAASDPGSELVIYGLGSCVGVAVHDAVAGVGGLLHALLPNASLDPARARANPAVFVDTGIEALLAAVCAAGAVPARLRVAVAGGAHMAGFDHFRVGERNVAAMTTGLGERGLHPEATDLGGTLTRTLRLQVGTGVVRVQGADGARVLSTGVGGSR